MFRIDCFQLNHQIISSGNNLSQTQIDNSIELMYLKSGCGNVLLLLFDCCRFFVCFVLFLRQDLCYTFSQGNRISKQWVQSSEFITNSTADCWSIGLKTVGVS